MPGNMRRKSYQFTPVIMIAEQHRNPADFAAIEHVHRLHGIVMSTMDTERSRKTSIGISEIGDDCAKCVARKLSGLYPNRDEGGAGWRAQIGTMGHDYLERHFMELYPWMFEHYEVDGPDGRIIWKVRTNPDVEPTEDQPIYYLERKLKVWEYGGIVIERDPYQLVLDGSCDLFARVKLGQRHFDQAGATLDGFQVGQEIGVVTDWKFQGPSALADTGKGKLKGAYKVQLPTYGLGYELVGFTPTHLDLHALPRDGHLDESRPILMRYDRDVAIQGIARIKGMIDGAAVVGWEEFITMMPKAGGCFDCDFYESIEEGDFLAKITA